MNKDIHDFLISILFVFYIVLHPPLRKVTYKSSNKEIDKYIWMYKNPFRGYPLIQFNTYGELNESYLNCKGITIDGQLQNVEIIIK